MLSCHGTVQDKTSRSRGQQLQHDQFGLVAGYRLATGPGAVLQAQARDSNRKRKPRAELPAMRDITTHDGADSGRPERRVGARSPGTSRSLTVMPYVVGGYPAGGERSRPAPNGKLHASAACCSLFRAVCPARDLAKQLRRIPV